MDEFRFSESRRAHHTSPLWKPLDSGGGRHSFNKKFSTASFQDQVLGSMPPPVATPKANLLANQLVMIDHLDGNRLLPRVHVDDQVFNNLCQPWVDTLVVKLLGKILSYNLLKDKQKRVWKLQSDFDLMAIANGYFMVKFNLEDDREQVVNGGSWMIDLSVPVVGKVWLRGHWYKVEYEGLRIIYSSCGRYGHYSKNCIHVKRPPTTISKGELEPPTESHNPESQNQGKKIGKGYWVRFDVKCWLI
ncbi:hypothetical protein L6164_023716 [Bauhinia variegata]|uniref:Uncharacterized protein n=1 Tax=Bauhinia variegata TaxID=167791 RepID=A0ACB9MP85_BAUVA|nr:hypothetical protein L6164_023716 [Bauhinia variegata]